MKFLTAGGCPIRRELFGEHAMLESRQCDGMELNIQTVVIGWSALQRPQRVVETYVANDVV